MQLPFWELSCPVFVLYLVFLKNYIHTYIHTYILVTCYTYIRDPLHSSSVQVNATNCKLPWQTWKRKAQAHHKLIVKRKSTDVNGYFNTRSGEDAIAKGEKTIEKTSCRDVAVLQTRTLPDDCFL